MSVSIEGRLPEMLTVNVCIQQLILCGVLQQEH